jgi:putative spermidine/putrescine transport system permease protein
LSGPLAWMLLIYIAALVVLFLSAFWTVDPFTGQVVHNWGLKNFKTIFESGTYRDIALRTVGIAAAVTVTDAILAFPFAYFAARLASRRMQTVLFVLVLLPLWSSYLARVYSWRLILSNNGALNWTTDKLHLGSLNIGYSNTAMWIVFSYIWLPFMITPVWAAIERVPDSLLEASSDLGASRWTTFRRVLLPLAWPGIVAGSIFTFSLTLGDYITPTLVGGASSDFIGNVVYRNVGVANNVPFAAAFATIPVVVMGIYLVLARRAGATDAL